MNHDYSNPFQSANGLNNLQQSYQQEVEGFQQNAAPFQPAAYEQGDNYYYEEDQTTANQPAGWYEVSCVEVGGASGRADAIRTIAFDPVKELIWVGTASGMLHSHYTPDMSRIVSSYICEPTIDGSIADDVRDITVSKHNILAAVGYGMAIVTRGGVLAGTIRADTIRNANSLALSPVTEKHVCIGGESRMLAVVDIEQQRILRQATLRGSTGVTKALWASPDGASNLAIFSTSTGRISFCDPATMREINAVAAFAGAATSIATSGYYLAATGTGTRSGVPYLEQNIKLYDIRSIGNPLPSTMFSAPPMFVAFDQASATIHNTEAAMWALSPNGVMQLLDISQVASGGLSYPLCEEIQLDAASDMFTGIAISSQGLIALSDTGGFIHQWSSSETANVNEESEPLWTAQIITEPPEPSIRLDELLNTDAGTTIPKCAIPEYENRYLTDDLFAMPDDPKEETSDGLLNSLRGTLGVSESIDLYPHMPFARFPLIISDDILGKAKRQSFVGYAQAPSGFVRNSQSGHKKTPIVRGVNTGKNAKPIRKPKPSGDAKSASANGASATGGKLDLSKPFLKSKYVEMDLVASEGIVGFNFKKYNRSALFCGLENALPNVYVNAAVQVLYFCPPIRKAIGSHSCDRDWCISCELGFLFHMFDLGGAGMACEAGNFTRAFMTMANAGALGLLDGPHALPLSQRIENFTRYLLEQLRIDDERKKECDVTSVFGSETVSHGTFTVSKTDWERRSNSFQHTINYDAAVDKKATFCELLEDSLVRTLDPTRAFCEASGQFESMSQKRELTELPNVLVLGCNTKSPQYRKWWFNADSSSRWQANMDSPDFDVATFDEEMMHNIAARAMDKKKGLLESMRLELNDGIHVTDLSEDESSVDACYGYDNDGSVCSSSDAGAQMSDYDLSFVIAHVPPSSRETDADVSNGRARNVGGHLVAYIRVPQEYRRRGNEGKSGTETVNANADASWWCFNDFVISPCKGFDEVAAFDKQWKKPCVLGYVRRDIKRRLVETPAAPGVDAREVIGIGGHNAAVGLQDDEATPGKGSVLALDCEFVMVGRDEADIFCDGTRQVVIPARMALARVSVIRGDGALKGTALIDDYVAVREPVVDYLTRFSGLEEGDLDSERSRHKVSSLKSVYKRLRCLVDAGCVFVGHGLKKDFRIINFVVPPKQVIDTVTLFHFGNRRLMGLRFLTKALLGEDIQSETHDSVEDSDAALRLYEVYVKLTGGAGGEGRFQKVLKDLYTYGYGHGWKIEADEPFVIDWSASDD